MSIELFGMTTISCVVLSIEQVVLCVVIVIERKAVGRYANWSARARDAETYTVSICSFVCMVFTEFVMELLLGSANADIYFLGTRYKAFGYCDMLVRTGRRTRSVVGSFPFCSSF